VTIFPEPGINRMAAWPPPDNLLAFQFHDILEYCDEHYRKAQASCSTRHEKST
jgi:hypothetical protein